MRAGIAMEIKRRWKASRDDVELMGVSVCGIERGVEGAWETEAASEASGLGD